jgi:hypothetical protein
VVTNDSSRGRTRSERTGDIESKRIGWRNPRAATTAGARALVLEQPFESVKTLLRRQGGRYPGVDLRPIHGRGVYRDNGAGMAATAGHRKRKIGQGPPAVKPRMLSHQ